MSTWAQRAEEVKRAAASERVEAMRAKKLRASLGARAFGKLMNEGRPADVALCEAWNAFTSDPANVARRDELAKDEEFMTLYYAALYADRVPEKRKRLKEFLKYVEVKCGWKGLEVVKISEIGA